MRVFKKTTINYNYMEPLSSFALSLAAGIALEIYNQSHVSVKVELQKAFSRALRSWCKNPFIRAKRRHMLSSAIHELLSKPELITDLKSEDSELASFYKKFEESIARYSSAYNYIKEIKDLHRFREHTYLLSNIKLTVEDTNKKFTEYIENNLPQKSRILEAEWKRQIEVYKENIYSFKPRTALSLLVKLEDSFISNDTKPSKPLLASIEFLKALCFELLSQDKDMHKCYIKAYGLDSISFPIKEKVCYSYAKIGENEKSNVLIKEVLSIDEFNPIAWAVKTFNSTNKDLDNLLSQTPQIVINDLNFKRIVYFNTSRDKEFQNQFDTYEKYNFFLNIDSCLKEEITLTNYKAAIYLIEVTLSRLLRTHFVEFTRIKTDNIDLIKSTNSILGHFLKGLSGSEILDNYVVFNFCYLYTEFVLHESRDSVVKMKELYKDIDRNNVSFLMILTNSLQLIGEDKEAIKIINEQENRFVELIHLKAFCHLKNSNIEEYIKAAKEIILLSKKIDFASCESILGIALTLNMYHRLDEIETSDFFEGKEFEFEYLKKLINSFIHILNKQTVDDEISVLHLLEDEIFQSNSTLNFYIPYSYYTVEKYNLALASFEKYISKEKESRDLYYYIHCLDKERANHIELLKLLELWRTKFSFNEDLLRLEADICRQLPDWDRCLHICEYFLSVHETDESFLTLELISLNELKSIHNSSRIEELSILFNDFNFNIDTHVHIVSRILIENGFHVVALNVLYKKAIDTGNIQARMDFFLAIMQMPEGLIQEKEIVETGCYVKYSLENEVNFIEIKEGNPFAERLIGCKKGDLITFERPILKSIDSIIILRIMDKYLCLHDEILEEVRTNPYSGFPIQSFEFKDSSPEGLNETFVNLFGAEGTIQKQRQDDAFKEYYNYNLSFTELIIQIYSSDYLGGYFNLVIERDGIAIIPMAFYPSASTRKESEYVIDFSSLPILYQISREHNIIFKDKFLISKGLVENIRAYLRNERMEPNPRMAINITLDGVIPNRIPEDATNRNIVYLEKLLEWIDTNCRETIVVSKLDIIRKLDGKLENEQFMNLLIENISLVMEDENRVLITDDSMYLKLYPIQSGKTISSELYAKTNLPMQGNSLFEFVKNRYIGYTITSEILYQEFNKKIKDQQNYYTHCISNCALRLIPSIYTIQTVVDFLKQISLNPVFPDELIKQEAINVLVSLLRGQKEEKSFRITELLIRKEFRLLGTKLDTIIESYNATLLILRQNL
jgi:hypothetical protein